LKEEFILKDWDSLIDTSGFLPVMVNAVETYKDRDYSTPLSDHSSFEMVYIKKGQAYFEIENNTVNAGANDVIIIKPFCKHKVEIRSDSGCEYIILYFKFKSKSNKDISDISVSDFLSFIGGTETNPYITFKVHHKNQIIGALNRLLYEKTKDDEGTEFLEKIIIIELFVYISRALKDEWESSIPGKTNKIKELINASISFIHKNFERDISLSDISRYVYLSTSYFSRAFKETVGQSPINYLLHTRIERSKELLKTNDSKISDIALSVGFSNQQRFNELFKKYTKSTPLEYRKQNKA
jgi:AraC-like DNA-binding protein